MSFECNVPNLVLHSVVHSTVCKMMKCRVTNVSKRQQLSHILKHMKDLNIKVSNILEMNVIMNQQIDQI